MSSGAAGPTPRRLPALARVWDGEIVPFLAEGLAPLADLVFLALPDKAAAEFGPSLVDAGVRVIDLSGAFRLRDAAARVALVSGNPPDAGRRGLRPHRTGARRGRRRPARRESGLLPDGGAAGAGAADVRRSPDAERRHHRRRQVGSVRCREDAVGADAFFRVSRQPVRLRRVQSPPRRRNRAGDRRARSRLRRISCRSTAA